MCWRAPGRWARTELLDQLRGAAPPTVYRALDFLLEHGLIHKVEKLSAFVGCSHRCDGEHIEAHAAQFLICKRCGRVVEVDDPEVGEALARAAQRNGFGRGGGRVRGLCRIGGAVC